MNSQTIFVSKYALTRGVMKRQAARIVGGKVASVKLDDRGDICEYLSVNDWHLTRDDAISRAERMRDAKVECLERQIHRLRSLKF